MGDALAFSLLLPPCLLRADQDIIVAGSGKRTEDVIETCEIITAQLCQVDSLDGPTARTAMLH
ncbi:hypothetical protein [Mesorhizobium sp.]|uniref:hypothetical protein n=1 Tax=Mesorhizobium sp. TaxID=1871066 RepID=UPI002600F44E|nr:hypothetical protein [Mesorhizobium sp.]